MGATTVREPAATGSGYLRWSGVPPQFPGPASALAAGSSLGLSALSFPASPADSDLTCASRRRRRRRAGRAAGVTATRRETGALTGPSGLSGRSELFPRLGLGGFRPLGVPWSRPRTSPALGLSAYASFASWCEWMSLRALAVYCTQQQAGLPLSLLAVTRSPGRSPGAWCYYLAQI
jgi:hypothetical protein